MKKYLRRKWTIQINIRRAFDHKSKQITTFALTNKQGKLAYLWYSKVVFCLLDSNLEYFPTHQDFSFVIVIHLKNFSDLLLSKVAIVHDGRNEVTDKRDVERD